MPEIHPPVDLADFAETIANNPQTKGSDWNRSCYAAVKAHIKNHYSILQDDICCYCKIPLRHGGYGEPIEHIVPKDDRPRWMFVPKNLALSCYPCNTKKNADNTLSSNGIVSQNYPLAGSGFIIFHPHFDEWNVNFEIYHKYFLRPISPKGIKTFEVCDLYRFNLPLDKAKMKGINEETLRSKVLTKVFNDPQADPQIIDQCKNIALEIIRRAREKKAMLGN